jgi:hypothetical protein
MLGVRIGSSAPAPVVGCGRSVPAAFAPVAGGAVGTAYMSGMTIVSYVHRPKRLPRKKKPAPALSVPAIVTHKRRYGPRPPKELSVDPEADARLVEFFRGMGLTYNP